MSTPKVGGPPAGVVVPPGPDGKPAGSAAVGATPMMGGGLMLSPLPLGGLAGGRRKSRRLSKKALKMLKKMTPKQLKALVKKGGVEEGTETPPPPPPEGGRKRRTRRGKNRSGLLY